MLNEKPAVSEMLSRLGIDQLNEMQQASIEAHAKENDLILLSDTGTGKTLAYLLPLIQVIDNSLPQTQAMIVVPSRELALQIEQVFRKMASSISITCCYGGHRRETEENNLSHSPLVIVGTPGRIGDHLRRKNIDVSNINTLVLDEFDKSLELGFTEEISFILESLTAVRKKILISATPALNIPDFAALRDPLTLDFLSGAGRALLSVEILRSPDRDKLHSLFEFICFTGGRLSIVFCNHRESVERTSTFLTDQGIANVFYHGAMEQAERELALCKFRNGSANILVTTDLAARGLDIPHIRYIIHYHLPQTYDIFTHRNGRTARMEASGTAVLIINAEERVPFDLPDLQQIELPETVTLPPKPKWSTLFIAAGKKEKVNKVDVVGFLSNKASLKREDIGLVEVFDHHSYAAIRKSALGQVLEKIKNEKIKNKKVKIDKAR